MSRGSSREPDDLADDPDGGPGGSRGPRLPADPIAHVDHAVQTSLRIARLVLEAAGGAGVDAGELAAWCPCFAERYLALLRAGGTLRHKELLAPFNLDAADPEFWSKGLGVIARFIDELEQA